MNKQFLITWMVSLFFGGFNTSKVAANDLKLNGLLGAVKSVTTVEYSPTEKLMTSIRVYDKEGNMIQETLKGAQDQLLCVSTFEPFEKGKFVEYINYNENGQLDSKESMRLNENGDVLSLKSFSTNDELMSSVSSQFDKQGNVVKTSFFDEKNELVQSKDYAYDEYGRLSYIKNSPKEGESFYEFFNYNGKGLMYEHKSVTVAGVVVSQLINEFDGAGNKIKTTLYPSLTTSAEHQITSYNTDGEIIESSFVNGDNVLIHKEEYKLGSNGIKAKSDVYDLVGDILVNSYTINYDDKGNEVSRVNFDTKGVPTSYIETSYEYDAQNNWIAKIEKEKDQVLSVVKRELNYF